MSDLSISATEHGKLRVFELDDQLVTEIGHSGSLDRLQRALGVDSLNAEDVQIARVETLGDLGLSGLLREGYDVTPTAEEAAKLDALEGSVALIRTAAFQAPVTLRGAGEAKLVATFTEGRAPAPKFTPLESDAAKGVLEGPSASAKPTSSFVNRLLLIVMAAMAVAFLWVFFYYIGF
ncbi:hypothetical protein [Litoreibacter arenae]|uniref:Uncharacterized protein n=1 Tax=Litoreibacter arenae DSM 19593 TaxID=1123360 RepID=S9RUQ8_9RHOB|nr:hypothetical protein [Litoreibacter arenae]EPX81785.1 hypothetical protein thalar_00343 [Litoreibacter arenae DSM 19593]